ncbi:MAG TPA: hypothetical protein VFJ16_20930 [Longimicrobium sp.]|nr:hypothetical protein [Longimicrobium sp.]
MTPQKILLTAAAAAAVLSVVALFLIHARTGTWNSGLIILTGMMLVLASGTAVATRAH